MIKIEQRKGQDDDGFRTGQDTIVTHTSTITGADDPDDYKYDEPPPASIGPDDVLNFKCSKSFNVVEQRPTQHSPRMGVFSIYNSCGTSPTDGVYLAKAPISPNTTYELMLRPAKFLPASKGPLDLIYWVTVDGCPPDDPDIEIEC